MTATADPTTGTSDITLEPGTAWNRLALMAGIAATLSVGAVSIALSDLEGAAVTAGFALSTGLTRVRRGRIGAIGLGLVGAITVSFMLAAALTNIRAGSDFSSIAISSALASVALLASIAGVGLLLRQKRDTRRGPKGAIAISAALLVILAAWGAVAEKAQPATGDIRLVSEDVAFSETAVAAPAGEITVTLGNRDLFWHTFTIEELDVDLRVPLGAELPVTFQAAPGEYRFICAIPGHPDAGMTGILTVEG